MENFEKISTPEKGCNIELMIRLMRHGKKDAQGGLSHDGEIEAKNVGREIIFYPNVKTYTSSVERVSRTADALRAEANIENDMSSRLRKELSSSVLVVDQGKPSPYFKAFLDRLSSANNVQDDKKTEEIKEVEIKTMQEWLAFGETRPDENTRSPKEVAQAIASLLWRQINMAKRLKSGSKYDFLDVTHEFLLAALMQYAVEKENDGQIISGAEIMKDKGRLEYLEELKIYVKTDNVGIMSVEMEIDKEKCRLNLDVVKRLAEDYRNK